MSKTVKIGQSVVVRTEKGIKVGVIEESKRMKNRKYYSVKMESGQIYKLIPFDKPDSAVWIDSKLSNSYLTS